MIHAEKRREDGGDGHYTLRYLVWNGDLIGSYGVHYGTRQYSNDGFRATQNPQDPNGSGFAYMASRDYHQLATEEQVAAHKEQQRYYNLSDAEQDAYEDEHGWPCAQNVSMDGCCYLPDGPSICDGSGLVEVTTDDRRAFEIAAMMANVDKETV